MEMSSIVGDRTRWSVHAHQHLALSDTGEYVLFIEDPLSKHPQFAGKLTHSARFEVTAAVAEQILHNPDYRWIPE